MGIWVALFMDIKKANAYIGYERISKLYAWEG